MRIFIESFKNELRKLRARKKYYVFFIIEIIICAIWGVAGIVISKASSGAITSELLLSGMPMSMLGFFIQVYIPLIIFMAACDLFAVEVHDGTIRASFMRPVSRAKQYFSKNAAIFVLAAIYLVGLFFITAAMQAVGAGSFSGLPAAFISYLLDIVPVIVLILFASMLNQFSSSTSLSIIICIIIYIGLQALGVVVPQASGILFTGYMQWHNLWVGVILPFTAIVSKIGMLAGYGIVFGCVGYYLFERREV